jgi:hypothetical protein
MRRDRYVRPRAKVFIGHPFELVMWSIGILLSGAITAVLRLHLKSVFIGVAYGNAACSGFARRVALDLDVTRGEIVCALGRNGVGKTRR